MPPELSKYCRAIDYFVAGYAISSFYRLPKGAFLHRRVIKAAEARSGWLACRTSKPINTENCFKISNGFNPQGKKIGYLP